MLDEELAREIERAVAGLPPLYRRLAWFSAADQSCHDPARATGLPVGTVKSRLFRARRPLAKQLGAYAGHPRHGRARSLGMLST